MNGNLTKTHRALSLIGGALFFIFSAVLALASVNAAFVGDYKPYRGETGILHKIIYLDLDQTYTPLRPDDYLTWGLILAIIYIIIVPVLVMVKAKEIAGEPHKTGKRRISGSLLLMNP